LVGGDLIHRALAQLAGGWTTPVAFSFGVYDLKQDRSFTSFAYLLLRLGLLRGVLRMFRAR
jgi:hypothetical protein